jgi:hypothetical protein
VGEDRDTTENTYPDTGRDELINELRDQVRFLREELARKDAIMLNMTESMRQLTAPAEVPRESPARASVAAERTATGEDAVGREQPAERPQQRSRWSTPVDKLPWWQYVLGLLLAALASYVSLVAAYMFVAVRDVIFLVVGLILLNVVCWSVPGVFGAWVAFRRTNPHRTNPHLRSQIISFGVLVGLAFALGRFVAYVWLDRGSLTVDSYFGGLIFGGVLLGWLFYVSGGLLGSAWQRRRTGRISDSTPASPESRKDWTARQQAIVGLAGTVIAALIGLFQSVIGPIVASMVGGG